MNKTELREYWDSLKLMSIVGLMIIIITILSEIV